MRTGSQVRQLIGRRLGVASSSATVSPMTVPPDARLIWSGAGSAAMIDFSRQPDPGHSSRTGSSSCVSLRRLPATERNRRQLAVLGSQRVRRSLRLSSRPWLLRLSFTNWPRRLRELLTCIPMFRGLSNLTDLAATLDMTEKAQGQIDLKYQPLASKILSSKTFPRGEAPFQDFANLITLRNELVHPRHRDRTTTAGHVEPISKVIRDLQQRGLTTTRGKRAGRSSERHVTVGRTQNCRCSGLGIQRCTRDHHGASEDASR